MTRRVSIREAAEADLRDAHQWYEARRLGLGDEFLVSIAEALASLESDAERFPIYHRSFRRVLTKRFPYRIFFQADGETVIVFRILHTARDHARQFG